MWQVGAVLWSMGSRCSVVAVRGLSSYGSRVELPHGMWNPPGPGIKPISPALGGRFLTVDHLGSPRASYILPTWDLKLSQSTRVGSNPRQGIRKVQGCRRVGKATIGSAFIVRESFQSLHGWFLLFFKKFLLGQFSVTHENRLILNNEPHVPTT